MASADLDNPDPAGTRGLLDAAPALGRVPMDRPWDWLAAGWRDLWSQPGISLAYGVIATGLGVALTTALAIMRLEALLPVVAGGFLLIGPLLAVGLYEKSRRLASGTPVTFAGTAVEAVRAAPRFGLAAAILLIAYLAWVHIAFVLLALFMGGRGLPPAQEFITTLLFTPSGLGLLIVGTAVGGVLAAVVFAITAISLPLLLDRQVDGVTAMSTSVQAALANPKPMMLWAALIAGFVALGVLTLGIGLIIVFPLIGHATWHAYRDLAPVE